VTVTLTLAGLLQVIEGAVGFFFKDLGLPHIYFDETPVHVICKHIASLTGEHGAPRARATHQHASGNLASGGAVSQSVRAAGLHWLFSYCGHCVSINTITIALLMQRPRN
jgi:hypothetical protein